MQRYDAVLFDVDGTLIHSRPGIFNCFAYAFRKMGLDPDAIDCSRYLGPPLVTPILKEQGLFDYFDRIGGASMDESVDNKTDVIRLVLQDPRLAGKRILMVGDRQDDMQGAVNNQLPAAAVLYGYGSREEMEPWNPVLLAQNCEELTQYILG